MSQDIFADAVNNVMNSKRAGKEELTVARCSKLLLKVLEIVQKKGYISYEFDKKEKKIKIKILKLNECKAIKPRFYVQVGDIDKYVRRYLPARGFGIIIISTSQGIMTQEEAYRKNIGGSLLAYFY